MYLERLTGETSKVDRIVAYTKELGIDIAPIIMTSISSDTTTIRWLNRTSLLYLVRPLLIRFALTVFRKYQFRAASMTRYRPFSIRSQYSLMTWYLWLICRRAGIHMKNTLMLIQVTKTAVPIMIFRDRRRSGTMTLIRLMMIWRRSWT
jgi:hypothetical protein